MIDVKCPFCGEKLEKFGGGDFPLTYGRKTTQKHRHRAARRSVERCCWV